MQQPPAAARAVLAAAVIIRRCARNQKNIAEKICTSPPLIENERER